MSTTARASNRPGCRGLEVHRAAWVARLPAVETGQYLVARSGARDLDQRLRWRTPAGRRRRRALALRRLHARRLAVLLRVVRRPRGVALPFGFVLRRQLEQRVERARMVIDVGMAIAGCRSATASCAA
jgi:hypothetical protein